MLSPQGHCLPHQAGNPLRMRILSSPCLSSHSIWNSQTRTRIWNRKSPGLGLTERTCCVAQVVSSVTICLLAESVFILVETREQRLAKQISVTFQLCQRLAG